MLHAFLLRKVFVLVFRGGRSPISAKIKTFSCENVRDSSSATAVRNSKMGHFGVILALMGRSPPSRIADSPANPPEEPLLLPIESATYPELESHGHAMLMVADLIDIVFAATMTDIQECLQALGKDIDESVIRKYLFLLEHLNIITQEYLDGSFYVTTGSGPYIGFDFKADARFMNRERAKISIRKNLNKTRARILRRYLRQAEHA
jgi:hypothetical protein